MLKRTSEFAGDFPQDATDLGPHTIWLHVEHSCQVQGRRRDEVEALFEWFGEGHMDDDDIVKDYLYDFELGVDLGKRELCFSASTAFDPARLPGGFVRMRAAYRTARMLLLAAQTSLRSHGWELQEVTSMSATVWDSGTDAVVMAVDYTPDLLANRLEARGAASGLPVGQTCRSMTGV